MQGGLVNKKRIEFKVVEFHIRLERRNEHPVKGEKKDKQKDEKGEVEFYQPFDKFFPQDLIPLYACIYSKSTR
jgi:hypothetical protein